MGTIPAYPTFIAGENPTAAKLNSLKTAADFWGLTPRCYAYATGAQTLGTSGTFFVVTLDAEVYDVVQSGDSPSHDNITQNTRIVARTSGKYEVAGGCEFTNNATGGRSINIRMNAAGSQAAGTSLCAATVPAASGVNTTAVAPTVEVALTAGDYIEAFVRQTSGASLTTVGGQGVTWLRLKLTGS